eukprot:CAMPEP_0115864124 /NCGR_PEP_ID=MMETSP0287-20121206/19036_1 /TAXON_ID=412157 /ORGANISM="Chrysochromulina rotalis, Strain UIO044" /LENGTH=276 /DNA_ID=CAMNT_0003318579 /DNA_START=30 /DNA_END=860 /DNA_ORIENTATION=-
MTMRVSALSRSVKPHMAVLPSLPVVAAVCTLPTCLGFWKSEYGVSYAYGGATAIMGLLVLRASTTPLAAVHAAALITYGVRLNLFLLWRELNVARFREFREKVEARAVEAGGRLKRTPFVLSCSFLYACLAAPVVVTTSTAAASLWTAVLVGVAWFGLLLAASGDLVKSWIKARQGPDVLVTSGPYRFFRHPNYTGEQILWTANMLAALVSAGSSGLPAMRAHAGWLVSSIVGWLGIVFVLAKATANLEKKQAERFAAYSQWQRSSWGGLALGSKE